jgi:hypothetical protein
MRWRLSDRFSLRADFSAGLYNYRWRGESDTRLKYGAGLSALFHISPSLSASLYAGCTQYAAARDALSRSVKAGAGIHINLFELFGGENRVSGQKTAQYPVFPVSYAWYEKNPVAEVRVINNEPHAITSVAVSLFLEQYMNEPTRCALIPELGQGQSAAVPLTAFFNESMLDLTGNITANARVLIDYRSLGAEKKSSFAFQMPVYHRNAMNWDDDRRAASFVSARDPLAVLCARYVESVAAKRLRPGVPRSIQHALGLFETLAAYGLKYLADSASPYAEFSENSSALDSLNYPYQTLLYRGGDCDDISILFCALLEVLKVETAFITTPGHIYIAFAINAEEESLIKGKDDFIEHGGRLWMPVEITLLEARFYQAWRAGYREWKNAGEKARLYPLREAWAVYPPVSIAEAGKRSITLPPEEEAARAFENALQDFLEAQDPATARHR